MKGLHEVVRHVIGAQRGVGYELLLHVNLSYSDSHEIFY